MKERKNVKGENLFSFLYKTFNSPALVYTVLYVGDAISVTDACEFTVYRRYLDMPSGVEFSLNSIFSKKTVLLNGELNMNGSNDDTCLQF